MSNSRRKTTSPENTPDLKNTPNEDLIQHNDDPTKDSKDDDAYMTAVESSGSKSAAPVSTSDVDLKIKSDTKFTAISKRVELLKAKSLTNLKSIVPLICMLILLSLFMIQSAIMYESNTTSPTIPEEQPQTPQNPDPVIPPSQIQIVSTLNLSNSTTNSTTNHTIIPYSTGVLQPVDEVELKISLPTLRALFQSRSISIGNRLIYARDCYFTENDPQVDNNKKLETRNLLVYF